MYNNNINKIGLRMASDIVAEIREQEFKGYEYPVTTASEMLADKYDKNIIFRCARVFGYKVRKIKGEWTENKIRH